MTRTILLQCHTEQCDPLTKGKFSIFHRINTENFIYFRGFNLCILHIDSILLPSLVKTEKFNFHSVLFLFSRVPNFQEGG